MDTAVLVEDHIDAGAELLARLIDDGFDVNVAFWIQPEGVTYRDLYIVSPAAAGGGYGTAFSDVARNLDLIADTPIGLSQIRLVDPAEPIAKEAIRLRDRHFGRLPVRLGPRQFGGITIEEGYVYPHRSDAMTQSQVLNTVLGLMSQHGFVPPSGITLADGTYLQATPTGIERQPNGSVVVTMINAATGTSQPIEASKIARIQ